jgi:molybdopterin converting factor small subunit
VGWIDRLFGTGPGDARLRVRVMLKGRIGDGWLDFDQVLSLPPGATLQTLFDRAAREGIPLKDACDRSPHLRHTLMWNGERCPVDEHITRPMKDGDEVYLLAPLAGG